MNEHITQRSDISLGNWLIIPVQNNTYNEQHGEYKIMKYRAYHDDVIALQRFLRYWLSASEIHQWFTFTTDQ